MTGMKTDIIPDMKLFAMLAMCPAVAFAVAPSVPGETADRGVAPCGIVLKSGWRFTRGDPEGAETLTLEDMSDILDWPLSASWRKVPRSGSRISPPDYACAREDFDDAGWKPVRVPHDFGVDDSFDIDNAFYDAYLRPVGIGWYRCRFEVRGDATGARRIVASGGAETALPKGGRLNFESDGAMSFAFVWVNGRFVGGWPYGYTPFECDLTDNLKDGVNVLAVRVHNLPDSSRWYTGGGLYRHCRLVAYAEDHVEPRSVFITTPEVTAKRARVHVRYRMSKGGAKEFSFAVDSPRLWDVEDPHLYTVEVEGRPYRYGIRTISCHPDERGFLLNGRRVQLKGVCLHHDFGVLGAAYSHASMKRRLLKLKEAGVNAIRSSHNQSDPDVLDLCDELGLLFMDECFDQWSKPKHMNDYWRLFDRWAERDLRAWIGSDRNHPCVIMWSLGNEIVESHSNLPLYIENARRLNRWAHQEDPTRPTCCANDSVKGVDESEYVRVTDVMGYNYRPDRYRWFRRNHPEVPVFGSEVVCLVSTRGEYFFPVDLGYLHDQSRSAFQKIVSWDFHATGYDLQGVWTPDEEWKAEDSEPSVMGGFTWSGFDYLGGPWDTLARRKKPNFSDPEAQRKALAEVEREGYCRSGRHSCNTGFFDLAGFRKDRFYLYQARWCPNRKVCHLLPHWNWPEREGAVTPVMLYATGDEAELFVNGVSQGRQKRELHQCRFAWTNVVYHAGEIRAVTFRKGRPWAEETVRTTGPAAKFAVEPEVSSVANDGEDLAYVTVSVRDESGLVVPRTRNRVRLELEGPGEIVASQNGDETDFEDFHSMDRHVFNGYLSVIVRANPGARGKLTLKVSSPDLSAAACDIPIRDCTRNRPQIRY